MYQKFVYQPDLPCQTGWDAYAETYATLLKPGTIYTLTKEVIHRQIEAEVPTNQPVNVLDLNCGVGNDFPFFLSRGWKITGCDGSAGMLNKASEIYRTEISSGLITLFQGRMETLNANTFQGNRFNLIYSVTGGFSYVPDDEMRAVNEVLANYLTPDGVMITAHLNKYCLSDTVYQLLHGRWKSAFLRWQSALSIKIKGEELRMHLRGPRKVRQLTPASLHTLKLLPLLWLTPPYQTGCQPPRTLYRLLRAIELGTRHLSILAGIADQVVAVARRKELQCGGQIETHFSRPIVQYRPNATQTAHARSQGGRECPPGLNQPNTHLP